jgi:hypothetical protein
MAPGFLCGLASGPAGDQTFLPEVGATDAVIGLRCLSEAFGGRPGLLGLFGRLQG